MSNKYNIEVTSYDIDTGFSDSCTRCPVALACERAGMRYVTVSSSYIYWYRDQEHYDTRNANGYRVPCIADLPQVARDFIHSYDSRRTGSPFSFEIEAQ